MGSSFSQAVAAAREAAGAQHYPKGALYVVATPIGNVADISLRALHVFAIADVIACEDTRHTQSLLRACGIDRTGIAWLAVHQHNESSAAEAVIARLRDGARVVYASDAGTPGVSDPGARLVKEVQQQGLAVVPVPGASSVIAVLSVAGAVGDAPGFVFQGFLPTKQGERDSALQLLAAEPRTVVLLEAPHRIEALARALAPLGERRVTVGRELTKQFEQVATLTCGELAAWVESEPQRSKGEFALVLHPNPAATAPDEGLRVLQLLLAELPTRTAVKLASEITKAPRNELYEAALRIKQG